MNRFPQLAPCFVCRWPAARRRDGDRANRTTGTGLAERTGRRRDAYPRSRPAFITDGTKTVSTQHDAARIADSRTSDSQQGVRATRVDRR